MLSVEKLTFSYRLRPVFKDVSFQVEPGSMVHIAGPNGCGKSTLLSVCAGLNVQENGRILWEDAQIPAGFLQYMPAEANGLFQKMSALENLSFWCRANGGSVSHQALVHALCQWGLQKKILQTDLPVAQFSTGMKRRLGFVKLSLLSSPLWILDEPLYGLDEQGVVAFRNLVSQHVEKGGLALVVSHDMQAFHGMNVKRIDMKKWKNV